MKIRKKKRELQKLYRLEKRIKLFKKDLYLIKYDILVGFIDFQKNINIHNSHWYSFDGYKAEFSKVMEEKIRELEEEIKRIKGES